MVKARRKWSRSLWPRDPRLPICRRRLRVIGISKRRQDERAENISFDVAEGEVLVLLGASGSGKTTILRIIAAGNALCRKSRSSRQGRDGSSRRASVASRHLPVVRTVSKDDGREKHRLRSSIRKRGARRSAETVNELLKLVQLEEHRKKYPSQLSGGQQQRVAIARTLAYKPEVLLFDEPFGALDTQTRVHLRREIRALLRKVNVPSIFITHDQEEALELGDRVAVLNEGHIEQLGTPYEIYTHPATEYVATFLARRT